MSDATTANVVPCPPDAGYRPMVKVGSMQKVVCALCARIFKVRTMPPTTVVRAAGLFDDGTPDDPYAYSALPLNRSPEAIAYSRQHCVTCCPDSPWYEPVEE